MRTTHGSGVKIVAKSEEILDEESQAAQEEEPKSAKGPEEAQNGPRERPPGPPREAPGGFRHNTITAPREVVSDQYLLCFAPLCCVGRKPDFFLEVQQPGWGGPGGTEEPV